MKARAVIAVSTRRNRQTHTRRKRYTEITLTHASSPAAVPANQTLNLAVGQSLCVILTLRFSYEPDIPDDALEFQLPTDNGRRRSNNAATRNGSVGLIAGAEAVQALSGQAESLGVT